MELAALVEETIKNEEGHLVTAAGQPQRGFGLVANEEGAEQAGVLVQPLDAHGVIVIPERRRVQRADLPRVNQCSG